VLAQTFQVCEMSGSALLELLNDAAGGLGRLRPDQEPVAQTAVFSVCGFSPRSDENPRT